jgi:hypothetical protein
MKRLYLIFIAILLVPLNFLAQNALQEERFGRHTYSEWRYMIDTTWGLGQSVTEKQQVFNNFWNWVDEEYAGFYGIEDKWDSLYCNYDSINADLSRGRFTAILHHMALSLHDVHVWIDNNILNSTPLQRDVPLFMPMGNEIPASWGISEHFGAGLTALPDSTLLVYNAVNNHPLGLMPGDILLGYDGTLWKNIYQKIFDVQFPIWYCLISCSEEAAAHEYLSAAGMNWHFFDTLDVVKYATGDTVHIPTNLITSPLPGIHPTEQMPIAGVPFPDVDGGHHVSWGYVEGTKIGYIYVYSWHTTAIGIEFLSAVNRFMSDTSSDGLIIDVRTNEGGGYVSNYSPGYRRLFNEDQDVIDFLDRADPLNHLVMRIDPEFTNWDDVVNTDKDLYDRPIAVLCGPGSVSSGDICVEVLRHHPMTRTFGKPTSGAFGLTDTRTSSEWMSGNTISVCFSPPDWNNILNRVAIPVDEEVWLTPEGVANGEDDVVNKALEWINNLVYPHNITCDTSYYSPGSDEIQISTIIENPNSHQLSVRGYIHNLDDVLIDSLELIKQTFNGEGEIWLGNKIAPAVEDFFNVSVKAFDQTATTSFTLPNATRFTTAGPVVLDSITYSKSSSNYFNIKVYVFNQGVTKTITDASVRLICNDDWVSTLTPQVLNLPSIPPGMTVSPSLQFRAYYIDSLFLGYFNFKVEIMSDIWTYWTDSVQVVVGVDKENFQLLAYKLEQNYPNPFNPSTTIQYSLKERTSVELILYDILGRVVEVLVNEEQGAGYYKVDFNAGSLASGIYLYRLKAGSFIETKKMLLIK